MLVTLKTLKRDFKNTTTTKANPPRIKVPRN